MAIERLWNLLGNKSIVFFGNETLSVSIWMFVLLLIRACCVILRIESLLPRGIIFAFPLAIAYVIDIFPQIAENFPLFPVRISEALLGRISTSNFSIIIPSHFFGCIFGAIVFKLICPLSSLERMVLQPLDSNTNFFTGFLSELILSCMYCLLILILPEMIRINKIPSFYLNFPILLLVCYGSTATFHPAANYALWYINNSSDSELRIELVIGSIIGGAIAGLICSKIIPDDASSWNIKPRILK